MPLKDADPSTPALFKWAAVLEGVTLLVLLGIAVPLKHLAGVPNGVSWVGPVHGVAFMVYPVSYTHLTLPTSDLV